MGRHLLPKIKPLSAVPEIACPRSKVARLGGLSKAKVKCFRLTPLGHSMFLPVQLRNTPHPGVLNSPNTRFWVNWTFGSPPPLKSWVVVVSATAAVLSLLKPVARQLVVSGRGENRRVCPLVFQPDHAAWIVARSAFRKPPKPTAPS